MSKYSMSSLITFFVFLLVGASSAQMSSYFYSKTCPKALYIIQKVVRRAVWKEPRMGASLLRLHFHDCFVQGCDASVLLDDTPTFTGEKTARPNNNSIRGFEVIDNIKSRIERICPETVSCADILTVAARDSVYALGGPSWTVPLGRRDSRTASFSKANTDLPSPFGNLSALISSFNKQGLTDKDMVTLSGGHTIGLAQCRTFRTRIYNDSNINAAFAAFRRTSCPISGGDTNLAPIDVTSPKRFDNAYYRNLKVQEGLFHADQELFNGGSTDNQVRTYVANPVAFMNDFARAMVKMANISLLTGSSGEIRKNCRKINA